MERVIANSTGFETKVLQNKRKDLFLHRGFDCFYRYFGLCDNRFYKIRIYRFEIWLRVLIHKQTRMFCYFVLRENVKMQIKAGHTTNKTKEKNTAIGTSLFSIVFFYSENLVYSGFYSFNKVFQLLAIVELNLNSYAPSHHICAHSKVNALVVPSKFIDYINPK